MYKQILLMLSIALATTPLCADNKKIVATLLIAPNAVGCAAGSYYGIQLLGCATNSFLKNKNQDYTCAPLVISLISLTVAGICGKAAYRCYKTLTAKHKQHCYNSLIK